MNARVRNAGVAVAGAAVLASGAYALGSQAGNGSASAKDVAQRAAPDHFGYGYGPPPGRPGFGVRRFHERKDLALDGLASRLGVTIAQLRAALQDIRTDLPSRDDLAAKLADALGLPADKVTSALGSFKPHRDRTDMTAALAKALGLDTAKVQAAIEKVKSTFR